MPRLATAASLAVLTVIAAGACTAPNLPAPDVLREAALPAPALALATTDSCPELLAALRSAARDSIGPYGFDSGLVVPETAKLMPMPAQGRAATDAAGEPPAYSGTNVNEAAADEPDTVKTDGKRIVSVFGQTLQVIDADSKALTGSLQLGGYGHQLLLHGDRALLLSQLSEQPGLMRPLAPTDQAPTDQAWRPSTQVRLVSLVGSPKIISTYEIGATLLDARQIGSTARVVVRSTPTIAFNRSNQPDEAAQLAANRAVIDAAPVDSWLPAYTTDSSAGRVGCGDVRRPVNFSGGSVVTMLSFGMGAAALGNGAAVSLLADSQTVYSNATNFYLVHQALSSRLAGDQPGRTEFYRFDISGDRPVYTASGAVPGWLLNQYSLSEHEGVLRIATTTGSSRQAGNRNQSSVVTLRQVGGELVQLGRVDGLGKGEQIYSVRFIGTTGYVVTFRQTDPLYTVDLRDPAHPAVLGELKIPGYSSYLHPVSDGRLLGLGRGPAVGTSRRTGTQVSLFDVSTLTAPQRVGLFTQPDSVSLAEHDPHAFLYWQPAKLVAVPMTRRGSDNGVLLLRIEDHSVSEVGWIETGNGAPAERMLVVGDTLWTFSASMALATSLDGTQRRANLVIGQPAPTK